MRSKLLPRCVCIVHYVIDVFPPLSFVCGSIRAVPFPVCPPSLCVKLHKQDARRGRTDTSDYTTYNAFPIRGC